MSTTISSPFLWVLRSATLGLCLIAALHSCAMSQGSWPKGRIAGKVVDRETREPLGGANVSLLGTKAGASADSLGAYLIFVAPGRYTIRSSYWWHDPATIESVLVHSDSTTIVNIALQQTHADTNYWESLARSDIASGNVQIKLVGLRILSISRAVYDSIVSRYGLRYESDCTGLPEAFHIYNRIVISYLDSLNGPGWQESLKAELEGAQEEGK